MEEHPAKKLPNIVLRILTALVLAPIVVFLAYKGGLYFKSLVLICAILMAYEWNEMTSKTTNNGNWKMIGIFYIFLPCISLIWMREQQNGKLLIYLLFSTVWATDIAAYFFGRLIGGWKILPKVSPNKTWSGLIAGAISAGFVGYIFAKNLNSKMPAALVSFCIGLAIYAQIGDFIESWIKRRFDSKDSGNILPGHGGIMDRVDGIVITAPKLAVAVFLDHWGIFN